LHCNKILAYIPTPVPTYPHASVAAALAGPTTSLPTPSSSPKSQARRLPSHQQTYSESVVVASCSSQRKESSPASVSRPWEQQRGITDSRRSYRCGGVASRVAFPSRLNHLSIFSSFCDFITLFESNKVRNGFHFLRYQSFLITSMLAL
jgi:hypothetical protein